MKIRISTLGSLYIVIMLMFGFAAINTSNNLLYLITSFMMGFMIVSGLMSYYNIKFLEIKFAKASDFFANDQNTILLSLISKKSFPSFLVNVFLVKHLDIKKEQNFLSKLLRRKQDEDFELFSEKTIFLLKAKEQKSVELSFVFEKRGHYRELDVYIASDFPFGFVYREIKFHINVDIYVYPNPKKCDISILNQKTDIGKIKTKDGTELYQIREYREDPLKFINWKASAKIGKLMANEFSDFINEEIMLRPEDFDMDLEQKLSCMSYITLEAMKHNMKVGLDWNGYLLPPDNAPLHHIKILRFLATV